MKKSFVLLLTFLLFCFSNTNAQKTSGNPVKGKEKSASAKKYPSLLWEISGNGLTKPSYLFGTMHVSDKIVFHLGDSFYNAIRSAEVIALETNPETWQDDFSKSVFFRNRDLNYGNLERFSEDYPMDNLNINSFAIDGYIEFLKASLAVEPSLINGMLYRTYGTKTDDFEEDTFLDMYIFQVGKKLGKRVAGVENFQESEDLVIEAYRDMLRDRHKKRRSYNYEGMLNNPKKMEDAYRTGDLDVLDSLQNLSVFSEAFQEKFLYKRNEIQANNIDSIIKRSPLFVGVGAAHLPGKRGVIEMLRRKGYKLRPVKMDERNSVQKDAIDKLRLPYNFQVQTSDDGFYKVSIPGNKFYRFTNWNGLDIVQYADMVNGAYYMVNRIKTNSLFFSESAATVQKKIDSLLYENIPGKILKKTAITRNGYRGYDIMNRTRRGDYQRYNIFVTPFEVILFKMSGNGEFVTAGEEPNKFFNSIQLQGPPAVNWKTWQPPTGGFSVRLPHDPLLFHNKNYGADRLEYSTWNKDDGNNYLVIKATVHNYSFFEEDSFMLNLLDESYSSSPFIDQQISKSFGNLNGFPSLTCKYKHKDGSFSSARYVLQGPIYYALITKYRTEAPDVHNFLASFRITPFNYPQPEEYIDTAMHFKVIVPSFKKKKEEDDRVDKIQELIRMSYRDYNDDDTWSQFPAVKTKIFGNDTIGEKIWVFYNKFPDYSFIKDSSRLWKELEIPGWQNDTSFIYKERKEYKLVNGYQCMELRITGTGSSSILLSRSYFKDGNYFNISTLTDTLSVKNPFISQFFSSFEPAGTLKSESLFTRKTERFFADFFSNDSSRSKAARRAVYNLDLDSTDAPLVIRGIDSLNWSFRNYLQVKKFWIAQLGQMNHPAVIPYLKKLYLKVRDTADLQHAILNALLSLKTKESFIAFKDLILQEPPISEGASYNYPARNARVPIAPVIVTTSSVHEIDDSYYGAWGALYDTLSLARSIFPDILQLMTIDDYEDEVMNLLMTMVDSGYIKTSDYENYFSKIYLDAKQLLKKQIAAEEKERIEKASNKDKLRLYEEEDDDDEVRSGNYDLLKYSILLIPFWDKNPGVPAFFDQLLKTQNKQVLYNTFILLLRNKKTVPDSLFLKYAKMDPYRSELYGDLKELKLENKFPAAYKNQESIARSLLIHSSSYYNKMDTISFINKLPVTLKKKKGYVYFFKYKRMKDDAAWQLASIGLQPENLSEVDVENDDFTEIGNRTLGNDKPVMEQLHKMLKEMLYAKRPAASDFYAGRAMTMYKNFLPDMVKRNRYRD